MSQLDSMERNEPMKKKLGYYFNMVSATPLCYKYDLHAAPVVVLSCGKLHL